MQRIILFLLVGFLFFSYRWVFFYKYEKDYYESYYYHSQWNIPLSSRGISDGELYKFIGWELASGRNPFDINFEVPPAAKYLYGLSTKLTNNPYWFSVISYLVLLWVFFKFTKSYLATSLLASTPFIFTQIRETMLDLPLTLFFFLFLYFFTKSKYIFSGIFLGLASGTKIAVFSPFLLILCVVWLILEKKYLDVTKLGVFTFLGYVLAYFSYFIKHPNPIPWARLHQKSIEFYLNPVLQSSQETKRDLLLATKELFNINLGDWSLVLPLGLVCILYLFFRKKIAKIEVFLVGFCFVILFVSSLIGFGYSRYIMPIIPVFCYFVFKVFEKNKNIFSVILLLNIAGGLYVLRPTAPDLDTTRALISRTQHHELYRSLLVDIKEEDFVKMIEDEYFRIGLRTINFEGQQLVAETNLGKIVKRVDLKYKKDKFGNWKLVWDWGYLPLEKDLVTKVVDRRMQVWSRTRALRIPADWRKISEITGEDAKVVEDRLKKFVPDHHLRFAGYVRDGLTRDEAKKLTDALPATMVIN